MRERTREILDIIDEALVDGGRQVGSELWFILTALRGPDSEDDKLKDQTTAPIRAAAFPRLAKWAGPRDERGFTHSFGPQGQSIAHISEFVAPDYKKDMTHFAQHVRLAARYLGLEEKSNG